MPIDRHAAASAINRAGWRRAPAAVTVLASGGPIRKIHRAALALCVAIRYDD
jgi:hypothetical protein